jgi:hypothetical protein
MTHQGVMAQLHRFSKFTGDAVCQWGHRHMIEPVLRVDFTLGMRRIVGEWPEL